MNITLKQLKNLQACGAGLLWFSKQKNKEAKHILRKCVKEDHFDWANWYVTKIFTHPQCVQYAIFNAEQVIHNFERAYPNEQRPRQAIEAAKAWLNDPTIATQSAAESAASAAWSAASAAWSAWSAAWSAWSAWSAAWSAASAAWSAWSAARSAWSAARSAESASWAARAAAIEYAITILGL